MQKQPVERKTGVLKWFNEYKGYGFICPDDDGPDIFVHANLFKLRNIEPVQFMRFNCKVVHNQKGIMAIEIERL